MKVAQFLRPLMTCALGGCLVCLNGSAGPGIQLHFYHKLSHKPDILLLGSFVILDVVMKKKCRKGLIRKEIWKRLVIQNKLKGDKSTIEVLLKNHYSDDWRQDPKLAFYKVIDQSGPTTDEHKDEAIHNESKEDTDMRICCHYYLFVRHQLSVMILIIENFDNQGESH
ncbi:hypothetical protein CBL_05089 [Carabus blaptoides fortunei]